MTEPTTAAEDPDGRDHTRDRQDLGYQPEVLAEPVGGPIPEYQPIHTDQARTRDSDPEPGQ